MMNTMLTQMYNLNIYLENLIENFGIFYFILATLLLITATFFGNIYYLYYWQLKEYRIDRMKDFLSIREVRKKIFNFQFFIKAYFVILLCIFYLINFSVFKSLDFSILKSSEIILKNNFLVAFLLLIKISLIALILFNLLEITVSILKFTQKKLPIPKLTLKSLLIFVLSYIAPILMFLNYAILQYQQADGFWQSDALITQIYYKLLTLYSFTPFIVTLIVLLFIPITKLVKSIIVWLATMKMKKYPKLIVVAITGSYGKSSVKELLYQILSLKYQVLKTPGNTNTEIGIARLILKNLNKKYQILLIEAGAYKIGEIKKIAQMVRPDISVITAVKDAHLGIFGSFENVKKAKFELIQYMKKSGIAIFNADNKGSEELSNWAKELDLKEINKYGLEEDNLVIKDIEETPEELNFTINDIQFKTHLPGRHNISNLLGACSVALSLGISLDEVAQIASTLKLRNHTMSVIDVNDDLVLIDDTYNANPDGVIAGLNYLNLYQGYRKIILFPGMLELGENSEKEHRRVAEAISKIVDFAYITSNDFADILQESFNQLNFSNFIVITNDKSKLLSEIKDQIAGQKTVILFISRGNDYIIKKLNEAT